MNILGIDFEDWFHPELIQRHIPKKKYDPKVIDGIDKILDWLNKHDVYATFFVVGELLEYRPELLDKILDSGHEIGFHTMYHTRLDSAGFKEKFDGEIKQFQKLTSGKSVGFRAPSFSLNHSTSWAIDVLEENGYVYDSSIMPVKTPLYGMSETEMKPYKIKSDLLERNSPDGKLIEFPLLVTKILGWPIPAGGGFYLRLLPLKIIQRAIAVNDKRDIPSCIYIHSWELTQEFMPKVPLPLLSKFITYYNLEKTLNKMNVIMKKFKFTSFMRYISEQKIL